MVRTDHILFIAAGAFHVSKPSDLIPELQGRFPIRVELQSLTVEDFLRILTEPKNALVKQYQRLFEMESVDLTLAEGDRVMVGSQSFSVMHVPGHAPGHVAFYNDSVVFGGDCLFAGSIGNSNILYGDRETLDASLQRLVALGDELTVYPGHGRATTIGRERETNPFLLGTARLVRLKR